MQLLVFEGFLNSFQNIILDHLGTFTTQPHLKWYWSSIGSFLGILLRHFLMISHWLEIQVMRCMFDHSSIALFILLTVLRQWVTWLHTWVRNPPSLPDHCWWEPRHFSDLTRDQQEVILQKSIKIQTEFCGKKPKGFTSPAWANSPDQIDLLEKYGIEYGMDLHPNRAEWLTDLMTDHSFMHDDFHPYFVSRGTEEVTTTNYDLDPNTWMVPMKHCSKSTVVEIPGRYLLEP